MLSVATSKILEAEVFPEAVMADNCDKEQLLDLSNCPVSYVHK